MGILVVRCPRLNEARSATYRKCPLITECRNRETFSKETFPVCENADHASVLPHARASNGKVYGQGNDLSSRFITEHWIQKATLEK